MQRDDLELQNGNGETALYIAAVRGDVEMAKIMVKKNEALLTIPNSQGIMPLSIAAVYGKHENMVEYLYDTCEKMTPTSCWTHEKLDFVLLKCVEAELFDIALRIVKDNPELAANAEALRILARKPLLFRKKYIFIRGRRIQAPPGILRLWANFGPDLELLRIIWSSILKLNKDEINDILRGPPDPDPPIEQLTITSNNEKSRPLEAAAQKPTYSSQMLFVAAECGNQKFLFELIDEYPDLIWKVNCDNNQSIFHVAVTRHCWGIFGMFKSRAGYIKDSIVSLEDEYGNNILHLAGERPKSNRLQRVRGVVLQMQHDLIWFKEVEAIVPRYLLEKKNKAGLTPREVFTKNHQDVVTKGEKRIKEVATQVMVASTLIAAVAFALPFTVPGGFHQEKGTPIFIHKKLFTVLVILDALSFMLASTSLLLVINILASSYAESDFMTSLPAKLIGCVNYFVYALVTMMSTFVIALFLLYQHKSLGVPISVAVFAFLFLMYTYKKMFT